MLWLCCARDVAYTFVKQQIKHWLAYQYMKDSDMDPKESGAHNPYCILLLKLAGMTSTIKPRIRTACNTWRKMQRKEIDHKTKQRYGSLSRSQQVTARDKIAKEMYTKLSEVEKQGWEEQAVEDHMERMAKWTEIIEGKISQNNADHQWYVILSFFKCIV